MKLLLLVGALGGDLAAGGGSACPGMSVAAHSAATVASVTITRVGCFALVACCLLIASCAANTGVVPNGSGSYIVAKQAATGFPGIGNLKAEALEEANRYCASLPGSGHQLFVTRSTETQPPYVLGNYPRAEIEFRCDAPSSAPMRLVECGAGRDKVVQGRG
jgi:hypothetical protein